MGFGNILKGIASIAAPIVGGIFGGPGGAAAGLAVGNALSSGGRRVTGINQTADPRLYPNIRIPGFEYPEKTPLVDMPIYGNAPAYGNAPVFDPRTFGATQGEQRMGGTLDQAHQALVGMLNPNSEIVRNLAAEEEQAQNQSFLQGLSQLVRLNNRQRSQGRGSFLDAEGGDQSIMSSILGNAREASLAAKTRARGYLGDVAGNKVNMS